MLPVGFAMRGLLPAPRWALTPPFHPYFPVRKRSLLCGTFRQVALPGRYPAPLSCGVRTFLEAPKGPSRSPSLPRPPQIELPATPVNRPIYTFSFPKYLWGGWEKPTKSESLQAHEAMPEATQPSSKYAFTRPARCQPRHQRRVLAAQSPRRPWAKAQTKRLKNKRILHIPDRIAKLPRICVKVPRRARIRPDGQAPSRQPRPVKPCTRITLASWRHIRMPDNPLGRDRPARHNFGHQ